MGHWTYECNNKRKYLQRDSRTAVIKKKMKLTKSANENDKSEVAVKEKKAPSESDKNSSGGESKSDESDESDESSTSTDSSDSSDESSSSSSDSSSSSSSVESDSDGEPVNKKKKEEEPMKLSGKDEKTT